MYNSFPYNPLNLSFIEYRLRDPNEHSYYPLVKWPCKYWIFPVEMAMFHSCFLCLPEGKFHVSFNVKTKTSQVILLVARGHTQNLFVQVTGRGSVVSAGCSAHPIFTWLLWASKQHTGINLLWKVWSKYHYRMLSNDPEITNQKLIVTVLEAFGNAIGDHRITSCKTGFCRHWAVQQFFDKSSGAGNPLFWS